MQQRNTIMLFRQTNRTHKQGYFTKYIENAGPEEENNGKLISQYQVIFRLFVLAYLYHKILVNPLR